VHRYRDLLPPKRQNRGVRRHLRKANGELIRHFRGLGLDLHTQDVVLNFVIGGWAGGLLVENHRPLRLARDREESIGAGRELLSLYGDVSVESDLRDRVGARAPDLVVGNESAPDHAVLFSSRTLDMRPAVDDLDLRDTDRLRNGAVRTRQGGLELSPCPRRRQSGEEDRENGRTSQHESHSLNLPIGESDSSSGAPPPREVDRPTRCATRTPDRRTTPAGP